MTYISLELVQTNTDINQTRPGCLSIFPVQIQLGLPDSGSQELYVFSLALLVLNHKMMSLAHPEKKLSSGSSGRYEDSDGCYLQKSRHPRKLELRQLSTSSSGSRGNRIRSSGSAANLLAKKRVIRMLIVIVVLFFLCWMPIFSANAWRAYDTVSAEKHLSGTPISFILLLSYTSSCVNPIIYCFMNKRFRLGFMATFPCCPNPGPTGVRGEVGEEEDGRTTGASLSRYSYSHMSTCAPPP